MENTITYVAMDTHKKQHKIALHYPCREEIVEFTISNTARDIKKMVNKIKKQAPGKVEFCYEAGVCGFTLKRRIEQFDCRCSVIAPSLVPRKPGERVKTDRRDAKKLLMMHQAGLLTEVHAPNEHQEAARELTRLRETAKDNLQKNPVISSLLNSPYPSRLTFIEKGAIGRQKHYCLAACHRIYTTPCSQVSSRTYFNEMIYCMGRLEALDKEVGLLADSEEYKEIVGLLRCFHGIDTLTAITIITEIFEFGRFESPRHLMSYLGLTPSEDSSGDKQKKGSITKTGNKRVRRLLNETSWHYRHRYVPSKVLKQRRKGQPQWVLDIADAAGRRLSKRHRHLVNNGKMPCKANIAVARELAGFIWFVVTQYHARKKTKGAA